MNILKRLWIKLNECRSHYLDTVLDGSTYLLPFVLTFSRALTEILLALISLIGIGFIFTKKIKIFGNIFVYFVFVFLLVAMISGISSAHPGKSLREMLNWLEYFILVLVIQDRSSNAQRLHIYLNAMGLAALMMAADALFQYAWGFDFFAHRAPLHLGENIRITASFSHSNGLGAFFAMSIPIFFASPLWQGWTKVLCALPLMTAILMTYSRGAWVGLVSALSFYGICINKKLIYGTIVVVACLWLLAPMPIRSRMIDVFNLGNITTQSRLAMWEKSFDLVREKPLLGFGLKYYSSLNEGYAHNCYLQMLVESGILGFVSFCLLMAVILYRGMLGRRESQSFWLMSSLWAGLIHSFFDSLLYSTPTATLFWFILGLNLGQGFALKKSTALP